MSNNINTMSSSSNRSIMKKSGGTSVQSVNSFSDLAANRSNSAGLAAATSKVSFSNLEVRHYPIVLGDNPACTDGPPVSIDWDYDSRSLLDIEAYEKERMNGDQPRRTHLQLMVPKHVRLDRLSRIGVSNRDIAKAVRQCRQVKHQRMTSIHNKNLEEVQEFTEVVKDHLKKLTLSCNQDPYQQGVQTLVRERQGFDTTTTNNNNITNYRLDSVY